MKKGSTSLYDWCKENNKEYLLEEWDYEKNIGLSPKEEARSSHKKVWWKCKNEHSWMATIEKRQNGRGCPYCSNKKVLKGYNDLSTTNPLLAKEWNIEKNDITSFEVTKCSNKKVWWKCEKGHEWEAVISSRDAGVRCPYCTGKKAIIGETDLATTHPHLLKEWDYEKNTITPQEVSKGSEKKVWWLCKSGHNWKTLIYDRTNGTGCPYCSNNQTSFPEQFLYYALSCKFSNVSNRHIIEGYEYDICIEDINLLIEYDGYYFHREIQNRKKKEIEKEKIAKIKGYDFIRIKEKKDINTVILKNNIIECNYRTNLVILTSIFDNIIVYINKNYKLNIDNILPVDIEQKAYENAAREKYENSLEVKRADLVKEWDFTKNENLKPSQFSTGSPKKVWWLGKCGHSWKSTIASRVSGCGCPYCDGKFTIKGETDLATTNPELLFEWDYNKNIITPEEVLAGSHKKVWWLCEKGHSYRSTVRDKVKGLGCPYCSNKRVLKAYNDLATIFPSLLEEWSYDRNILKPEEIMSGSHKKVWWVCKECGYEWESVLYTRVKGCGCPECAKKRMGVKPIKYGEDLATVNPKLASEWNYTKNNGLTPKDVTRGSNKKVWWICAEGHEWQAVINSRSSGRGCSECARKNKKNIK